MVLHHIFSSSSYIFEQHISGTINKTCWPKSSSVPSLDLYLLEFYVWEHLKPSVYATEICDFQDLNNDHRIDLDMIGSIRDIF
jgi:hypothetical protein